MRVVYAPPFPKRAPVFEAAVYFLWNIVLPVFMLLFAGYAFPSLFSFGFLLVSILMLLNRVSP